MSGSRPAAVAPDLPGFTYVDLLGSGGFADVYLYEQQLPKRRVAVKVLLIDRMPGGSAAEFTTEADVMAMLSTHPAIVTIHQAGVAGDGRPYLVMEYCPKPNLQARYRRERFSVAEALRVGVQVAAAVETAHRAGVLHRDIKPANILVTEYNRPALTDFGIASPTNASTESAGLSIPWSPPESFADTPRSDPRSDVWALAATVYTLLAGRAPFELPGERNTGADLIQRIERMPLPPLERPDVPSSLEAALRRGMAKATVDRYDSALSFARALQKVQIELAHAVTPVDILDEEAPAVAADEDDGLTRVRGVVSIAPDDLAAGTVRRAVDDTRVGGGPAGRAGAVAAASAAPSAAPDVADTPTRRRPTTIGASPFEPPAADASAPATGFPAAGASGSALEEDTIIRPPGAVPAAVPGVGVPAASIGRPAVPPASVVAPPPAPVDPLTRARRLRWTAISGGALVLVAAVVVGVSVPGMLAGPATSETPVPPAETSEPQDPISAVVGEPQALTGAVGPDGVTFTWTNPDPREGDRSLWGVVTLGGGAPSLEATSETTVTVPADPAGRTCLEVTIVRENGQASDAVTGCVP